MPKTTEQKTPAAEQDDLATRIQTEKERILAGWERNEQQAKAQRADVLAQRTVFAQFQQERVADIGYWEKRYARYGLRPVLAAWPTIPDFPRSAASPIGPDDKATLLDQPRPVLYNAHFYRLDQAGVWLRQTGYWIASPVFQTARGVDAARPALYAVEVDGNWRTVPVDPRRAAQDDAAILKALTTAGLRLNPEPVHHDVSLNAVAATGALDHYTFTAGEKLNAFLDDHARELP